MVKNNLKFQELVQVRKIKAEITAGSPPIRASTDLVGEPVYESDVSLKFRDLAMGYEQGRNGQKLMDVPSSIYGSPQLLDFKKIQNIYKETR